MTNLRMVVFGATGATGQILVERALAQGFQITALVRRPERLTRISGGLRVIQGNIYDDDSVMAAIQDQDVVISLISVPFTWKAISIYSQSARSIVKAMQAAGVRRLFFTSAGASRPGYYPGEGFVFGRLIKPTIGRSTYIDMCEAEAIITSSNLDWTIVRPAQLTNRLANTDCQTMEGYVIPKARYTGRSDLADFFLDNINNDQYHQKGIAIASKW